MATASLKRRRLLSKLVTSLIILFPLAGIVWGVAAPGFAIGLCLLFGFLSGVCFWIQAGIDTDNPPYEEMIIYKCDYTQTAIGGTPEGCGQYYGKGYCEWLEDKKIIKQTGPSEFFVSDEDPGECFCNAVPYRLVPIYEKKDKEDV